MKANYKAWGAQTINLRNATPEERLQNLISFAVLAPSAHNTQPWRFTIHPSQNSIEISLNPDRLLPASDPSGRQATLSLGAAIENICTAATAYGATVKVRYKTSTEASALVTLTWPAQLPTPDEQVFQTLRSRMTNRSVYKPEVLDASSFSAQNLNSAGITTTFVTDANVREQIASLASKADLQLMNDEFKKELAQWVHPSWTTHSTGMPASVQGMPLPVSLIAKFIIPKAPIEKDQAKKDAKQISGSPLLAVISGASDDTASWLEGGRVFERLCLEATSHKLDTAPLASIVESPETRQELKKLLGLKTQPLALIRIGHSTKAMPRCPRLLASEVTA